MQLSLAKDTKKKEIRRDFKIYRESMIEDQLQQELGGVGGRQDVEMGQFGIDHLQAPVLSDIEENTSKTYVYTSDKKRKQHHSHAPNIIKDDQAIDAMILPSLLKVVSRDLRSSRRYSDHNRNRVSIRNRNNSHSQSRSRGASIKDDDSAAVQAVTLETITSTSIPIIDGDDNEKAQPEAKAKAKPTRGPSNRYLPRLSLKAFAHVRSHGHLDVNDMTLFNNIRSRGNSDAQAEMSHEYNQFVEAATIGGFEQSDYGYDDNNGNTFGTVSVQIGRSDEHNRLSIFSALGRAISHAPDHDAEPGRIHQELPPLLQNIKFKDSTDSARLENHLKADQKTNETNNYDKNHDRDLERQGTKKNESLVKHLCGINDLPDWYVVNKRWIINGFRVNFTNFDAFISIFQMHNETV